jgi:hypothetical protein
MINLHAYQLEDKLKVAIIGKIAKFVQWNKPATKNFSITVLNTKNQFFKTLLEGKRVNSKPIKIIYINNINNLKESDILYISQNSSQNLQSIFKAVKNKNILTISDIRGFAQKGGMIQLYTKNQKLKLRINVNSVKAGNLKIKSSLLRISTLVKENK